MENQKNQQNTTLIKIDVWSIVKIILLFLCLWILYLIRDIVLIIFSAGLVATITTPMVNFFEKRKFPRWLGAMIIYFGIILVFGLVIVAIVPMVVSQTETLYSQLPEILKEITGDTNSVFHQQFEDLLESWTSRSSISSKTIFSFLGSLAGQIVSFFMIFLLSFYLSIRKKPVREFVNSLVPGKYQNFLENFVNAAKREIGAWARGIFLLCLFVGGLVYLGLIIMGVEYPLTLAVIAGLFEIIPYVGPWLAGVIATIVALTQSPSLALFVIIFYLVVQQIENAIISPNIMHRAVGLDPMVVIIALLIGGKLAGPMGMILAVPLATIAVILIKDYLRYREKRKLI